MAAQHIDAVREMKRHKPFVPFRIVTKAGEEHLVQDRFQFAVSESRVLCYLAPKLTRFVELTADQIASVEPVRQKPAA